MIFFLEIYVGNTAEIRWPCASYPVLYCISTTNTSLEKLKVTWLVCDTIFYVNCTGCIRCPGTFWFRQPAILGAMRVAYPRCLRTYHIISQGYSEVAKSLQRCCDWVFHTESLLRHTYYVNLRWNCDICPLVTGKWAKTLSYERCLVEAGLEGGPLTVESMVTSSGSCSHDCFFAHLYNLS